MPTVQLCLSDARRAAAWKEALERCTSLSVRMSQFPDPRVDGVVVVDQAKLDSLTLPLAEPERFVLITSKDRGGSNSEDDLTRAWDCGIRSALCESEPIETILLAIEGTALRCGITLREANKLGNFTQGKADGNQGCAQSRTRPSA